MFSPHSHYHPGGAALQSPLATILSVHLPIASHRRPVSIEKRPRRGHRSWKPPPSPPSARLLTLHTHRRLHCEPQPAWPTPHPALAEHSSLLVLVLPQHLPTLPIASNPDSPYSLTTSLNVTARLAPSSPPHPASQNPRLPKTLSPRPPAPLLTTDPLAWSRASVCCPPYHP
jgi:hypothetical protein